MHLSQVITPHFHQLYAALFLAVIFRDPEAAKTKGIKEDHVEKLSELTGLYALQEAKSIQPLPPTTDLDKVVREMDSDAIAQVVQQGGWVAKTTVMRAAEDINAAWTEPSIDRAVRTTKL